MTDPPDPISPFVTSTTSRVFALRGLPEEVVAVLFAYYSRSTDGLRENLRKAIADGDIDAPTHDVDAPVTTPKTAAFHEKWTVAYGHGSVGEHAVVHLGVEPCSVLAAKAIEDCRLGTAFTEQSTRYVPYNRTTYLAPEVVGVPAVFAADYRRACEGLLMAYGDVCDELSAVASTTWPDATVSARRGWVLDRARSLLPTSIPTRVGVSLNAHSAAHLIRKLHASEHPELRAIGDDAAHHAGMILPSLVRHVAAEPGRVGMRASLGPVVRPRVIDNHVGVRIEGSYDRDELRAAMIRDAAGDAGAVSDLAYTSVVQAYLGSRGAHERPGRALEAVTLRMRLRIDYGAWRDVQRHRTMSAAPVRLNPRSGFYMPGMPLLSSALQGRVGAAVADAQRVGCAIEDSGSASAEYVQPLGTMIEAVVGVNVRAMAQFIELRSGREGHDRYREVAHKLHDYLTKTDPVLAAHIRCDRRERTLART